MKREELKEWLGLKPADLLVYLSAAAIACLYFNFHLPLDVVLSVLAILLCVAACVLGMRSDPRVSRFTNIAKFTTYPFCLVACIVLVYMNFAHWSNG